jgi:hypothetical protein
MTITLGEDWQDFFDFTILNMHKPLFWNAKNPFYSFEPTAKDSKGAQAGNSAELSSSLEKSKILLAGNAYLLTEFLQSTLDKSQIKVCYFGTHFLFDV